MMVRFFGSNTDAFGFIENLKAESSWQANDGPAVILGAGGAARAVVAALIAEGVAEIRILNRTFERAARCIRVWRGLPTARLVRRF